MFGLLSTKDMSRRMLLSGLKMGQGRWWVLMGRCMELNAAESRWRSVKAWETHENVVEVGLDDLEKKGHWSNKKFILIDIDNKK